nr:MAG TPA: hypothetical protein [Caudoviricetes sp.]
MSFSDKLLEIMKSPIRPKCEPKITVTGTAADGTTKTIEWNAKDIKSLSFHRSIDPVGRNLPIMELSWTEVYYGKLNAQNFPIKYNNIAKYMTVNLEFHQFLGFYQTWKTLKSMTWKQVKSLTWKKVKNEVAFETVKMPMMFLSATPEISGHTIKWTAKDALSFLTENQVKEFGASLSLGGSGLEIPRYNPIVYLLVNARAAFNNSKELFDYYTRTINYFTWANSLEKTNLLPTGIIFDGATNSEIMNYLSPLNEYLDFDENKIIKKTFMGTETVPSYAPDISLNLQYGNPTCEPCTPMSAYSYKQYRITATNGTETVSPSSSEFFGVISGKNTYKNEYYFKGYGQILGSDTVRAYGEINRAIALQETQTATIDYNPLDYNPIDYTINIANTSGESYNEDNHLNIYGNSSNSTRATKLSDWFSKDNHVIKNQTPAIFNWEIGSGAYVETQLWDDTTNRHYIAFSKLLEYNIEYNGAIRQSNIAHEVKGKG